MNKEVISNKQGISIISLFIMGSSMILTTAGEAKKDIWIALILSILSSLPIVLVHARLQSLFPKKDLYDILEFVLGKFIGKGISILFIGFSFFLCGLVLRVFGDFIYVVALADTPKVISMIFTGALSIWIVKEGIEVIGRWGEFFFIVIIVLLMIIFLLLIDNMNINNLCPLFNEDLNIVIKASFHAFVFPFTQTIIFTTVFSTFNKKDSYKVYTLGILIGWAVLFIFSVNDILVLGVDISGNMYFPSYASARLLKIGTLPADFEIIIAVAFLIGGFIKVSMCLLSTCNGIAKTFGFNDYRFLVTPIGLLVINLSYFIHGNVMEKSKFALEVYPFYALPFQVILPMIILILAEIKKKQLADDLK